MRRYGNYRDITPKHGPLCEILKSDNALRIADVPGYSNTLGTTGECHCKHTQHSLLYWFVDIAEEVATLTNQGTSYIVLSKSSIGL